MRKSSDNLENEKIVNENIQYNLDSKEMRIGEIYDMQEGKSTFSQLIDYIFCKGGPRPQVKEIYDAAMKTKMSDLKKIVDDTTNNITEKWNQVPSVVLDMKGKVGDKTTDLINKLYNNNLSEKWNQVSSMLDFKGMLSDKTTGVIDQLNRLYNIPEELVLINKKLESIKQFQEGDNKVEKKENHDLQAEPEKQSVHRSNEVEISGQIPEEGSN